MNATIFLLYLLFKKYISSLSFELISSMVEHDTTSYSNLCSKELPDEIGLLHFLIFLKGEIWIFTSPSIQFYILKLYIYIY